MEGGHTEEQAPIPAEQGYKGKDQEDVTWDYTLKPVIGVFLCNFTLPALDPKVVVKAAVLDEESYKPIGVKTRYYFIQLPKFDRKEEECVNPLDMWLYNLKNMGVRQEIAFMQNNKIFQRLEKITSKAALSPEELRSYEADVKNTRDTLNQIRGARLEGLEEGRAEGRAEVKFEMAKKMKQNGMTLGDILLYTGLSEQEIRNL